MKKLFCACVLSLCTLIAGTPVAEAAFPERPVFITVGFVAGGNADLASRALAVEMEKTLGQPVVIVNKGGGGGALAIGDILSKPADGYNIGAVSSQAFTLDALVKNLRYKAEDMAFLGTCGMFQSGLCSSVNKPWKTLREMLDYAKKNDITLTCGSPITEDAYLLKIITKTEGVKFKRIPTKGGGETFAKVLGEQIDFGVGGGLHIQYVLANKMNHLAYIAKTPPSQTPDTPSLEQSGLPALGWDNPFVFFVLKDVPQDVVKTLSDALYNAARSEPVQKVIDEVFLGNTILTGEEVREVILDNRESYKKLLEMAE